jgi:hypothetical protein
VEATPSPLKVPLTYACLRWGNRPSVLWLWFADAIKRDVVAAQDGEAVAGLAEREALPIDCARCRARDEEAMAIRDAIDRNCDVLKIRRDDPMAEIDRVGCLGDTNGKDAGAGGRIRVLQ